MDETTNELPADALLAEDRHAIVAHARRMLDDGLVVGTSGNLSVRRGELVAVTPTGIDYRELTADQVGVFGLDGGRVEGRAQPSSELATHLTVEEQRILHELVRQTRFFRDALRRNEVADAVRLDVDTLDVPFPRGCCPKRDFDRKS